MILLKAFQRLGYFPNLQEIPGAVISHIRAVIKPRHGPTSHIPFLSIGLKVALLHPKACLDNLNWCKLPGGESISGREIEAVLEVPKLHSSTAQVI